jgi:hypothetical protein
MGGPPCWKDIIDQRNALVQKLDCMSETIRIAGVNGEYPTEEEEKEFITTANALALVANKIQERLGNKAGL